MLFPTCGTGGSIFKQNESMILSEVASERPPVGGFRRLAGGFRQPGARSAEVEARAIAGARTCARPRACAYARVRTRGQLCTPAYRALLVVAQGGDRLGCGRDGVGRGDGRRDPRAEAGAAQTRARFRRAPGMGWREAERTGSLAEEAGVLQTADA
eukprot:6174103-Pleurochrysis_carterae.AAC.2